MKTTKWQIKTLPFLIIQISKSPPRGVLNARTLSFSHIATTLSSNALEISLIDDCFKFSRAYRPKYSWKRYSSERVPFKLQPKRRHSFEISCKILVFRLKFKWNSLVCRSALTWCSSAHSVHHSQMNPKMRKYYKT